MDLAIGIDVGFTQNGRSTGVVIIDSKTKNLAQGTELVVENSVNAVNYINTELTRLNPAKAVFCIDGPFASAGPNERARVAEKFFSSGPFASSGDASLRMRLMPAPTAEGGRFLQSTRAVLAALIGADPQRRRSMKVNNSAKGIPRLEGDIIEIFPTLFMASLLPPLPYAGDRNKHTDELWLQLTGHLPVQGISAVHPSLIPYVSICDEIERAPRRDRHDLRAAAISAIAADWFAAGSSSFIGTENEFGFIFPDKTVMNITFLQVLDQHWINFGRPPLLRI